jgi:LysR family transcriptional regulator, nitrogen assimilation regulatory protein
MDLRQLRYFIAIAESASLSDAARKVHVVQSALSKRLSDLEEELGVQLIVRGRLGTALTDAGKELYEHSLLITKQIAATKDAVRERSGVVEGSVTVGVLRTLAPAVGARLFALVKERLPGVIPDIRVGYSAELSRLLREGRLDITMQLPHPGTSSRMPVYSERLCVVGSYELIDHRLPALIGPQQLSDLPLILSSMRPVHSLLLGLAERMGIPLRILGGIEDIASVLDLCEAGMAATVIPEWGARKAQQQRKLTVRVLDHPELMRTVTIAVNENIPRNSKVIVVEELMTQVLEELMAHAAAGSEGP